MNLLAPAILKEKVYLLYIYILPYVCEEPMFLHFGRIQFIETAMRSAIVSQEQIKQS